MGTKIKGKFIRIQCDNDRYHYQGINIGDYSGHTFEECYKNATSDGWRIEKEDTFCPQCQRECPKCRAEKYVLNDNIYCKNHDCDFNEQKKHPL